MLLIVELFRWWYTDGWKQQAAKISVRLDGTMDYFSIDLLIKTLFSPFRQISAGAAIDGPLGVQLRAMLDNLFSRVIGGVVRTGIIIVAIIVLAIQSGLSLMFLVVWAALPVFPLMGLVLAAVGPTF